MKTITKTLSLVACAAAFSAPRAASADDAVPSAYSYAWHDSRLRSDYGITTLLGGGLSGFTDKAMRDTTSNVGGLWDLRVTLGSHIPIALDLGYIGSAQRINSLSSTQYGTLLGTTVEGALRWNVLPHNALNPYLFLGVGWQRYDVTGGSFRLSDQGINDSDNLVAYPMGGGLQWRDPSGLVIDAHGTFRPTSSSNLVVTSMSSGTYAPMHSWEASLAAGYEF